MEGVQFWTYIAISVGLTMLAGLMSGLTLGLLSLDSVDVEVLKRSGTEREKKYVKRIEPVIANTHLLLVTLLLTNAAAMEALPIFLDRLVSPMVAVILSVTAVLFFGEIIPQAACKSYGLAIGAYAAPLVRGLILLEWVIAKPISMVLDWALGEDHSALFRRGQLKALVDLHSTTEGMGGYLNEEEINVIRGALDLTGKQATVAMTPLDKVFMLALDAELNEATLRKLLSLGHSRVPVHTPGNRNEILGLILVKELILVDQHAGTRVCDLKLRGIPHLRGDVAAYDLLKLFQTGRSHMVVLTQPPPRPPRADGEAEHPGTPVRREHVVVDMDAEPSRPSTPRPDANCGASSTNGPHTGDEFRLPIGIVTIEDLIEELIGTEILDETDEFVDNLRQERVNKALLAKTLPPNLRKLLLARSSSAALSAVPPAGKKLLAAAISAGSDEEGGSALRQALSEEGQDALQPLLRSEHGGGGQEEGG